MTRRARLIIDVSDDAGIGHEGGMEGYLMRKAEQIAREIVDRSDTCATAHVEVVFDDEDDDLAEALGDLSHFPFT